MGISYKGKLRIWVLYFKTLKCHWNHGTKNKFLNNCMIEMASLLNTPLNPEKALGIPLKECDQTVIEDVKSYYYFRISIF